MLHCRFALSRPKSRPVSGKRRASGAGLENARPHDSSPFRFPVRNFGSRSSRAGQSIPGPLQESVLGMTTTRFTGCLHFCQSHSGETNQRRLQMSESFTNSTSKAPSHAAYHVRDTKGGNAIWTRIGSAWQHADGKGFNIRPAVPPWFAVSVFHPSRDAGFQSGPRKLPA